VMGKYWVWERVEAFVVRALGLVCGRGAGLRRGWFVLRAPGFAQAWTAEAAVSTCVAFVLVRALQIGAGGRYSGSSTLTAVESAF